MGLRFIHHSHGYQLTKADTYVKTEGKRFRLQVEYFQNDIVCFKTFEGSTLQEVDESYALWNTKTIVSSLPPISNEPAKRTPVKLGWIGNQLTELKDEPNVE